MKALIVGAGPSLDLEYVKNFDGIVITTDRTNKTVSQKCRIPEYCVSVEDNQRAQEHFKDYFDQKTKLIVSRRAYKSAFGEQFLNEKVGNWEILDHPLETAISNVGIYGILVASDYLKIQNIDLTGMDSIYYSDYMNPWTFMHYEVFWEMYRGYFQKKKNVQLYYHGDRI